MAKKRLPPRREALSAAEIDENRCAAQAAGCTFFIGKPCLVNRDHGSVRYTNSGHCKECSCEGSRARAKRNYQARKAAKSKGNSLPQGDTDAFPFVAFTLGNAANIQRWLDSISRKVGVTI